MKSIFNFSLPPRVLLAGLLVSVLAGHAFATGYLWDPSTTTGIQYGSGTWDTTTANWNTATPGTNIVWVNGTSSALSLSGPTTGAPASETLTLGADITLNNISMGGSYATNVIITGSHTLTLAGTAPNIANNNSADSVTLDVVLLGTSGLLKYNAGLVVLSQNNTYSGGTTIEGNTGNGAAGGALQIGNGGTTGSLGGGDVTFVRLGAQSNAATLRFDRSDAITVSNNITISDTTNGGIIENAGSNKVTLSGTQTLTGQGTYKTTSGDVEISGQITGGGALTKTGTGTLLLSGGTNNYTGGTKVTQGTLMLGSATALGSTTASLAVTGATVDLAGHNATVGALTGAGTSTGVISNSSATAAALTATSVNVGGAGVAGLLIVGDGASASTATLNVTGATLTFDIASNAAYDQITLGSNGALTLSGTTLNLNFTGTSLTAGSLELIAAANNSQITSLSGLTLGTTSIDGFAASLSLDAGGDVILTVAAVPEPSLLWLLALGGMTLLFGVNSLRRQSPSPV